MERNGGRGLRLVSRRARRWFLSVIRVGGGTGGGRLVADRPSATERDYRGENRFETIISYAMVQSNGFERLVL